MIMATVAIILNTAKKLTNQEHPVCLRITHDYKRQYFSINTLLTDQSTRYRCAIHDWKAAEAEDQGLGKFRKSFPNFKECNEVLELKLKYAQAILAGYDKQSLSFSFERFEKDLKSIHPLTETTISEAVTEIVLKETSAIKLFDYYAQQISILDEQERTGLSGLFLENQRILGKFRPDAILTDVNYRFLESLEYWLRNVRKNKDTSISVKMRNLQRVINLAIEDKLLKREDYPFGEKKYSVNKRLDHTTKKIAIHTDKVSKLRGLILQPGSALHFAQQLCLFSYYCRGMNFIDMCFLRWENISDTHIEYIRKKTRGKFSIPLNDYNRSILMGFESRHTDKNSFIFPIIDPTVHITPKQQYIRKKTALKAVNDNLKKLAAMMGEPNLKLSTNVLRHSYATGLKRAGVGTSYITEALGHATQEQTQTYLDEFEAGVIEGFEEKLFSN